MAKSTTNAENERIARRMPEDIATEGRLDLIREVFTEDAIEHDTVLGDPRGHDELRDGIERLRAAFPDFSATVEDCVTEGDTVALRLTLRGTQDGEFMGQPASGKSFDIQNMAFTRIEDGKIAERWVQPDTLGMMTQLGIVSTPKGIAAD